MALEDFERELAESKAREPQKKRDRSRSRDHDREHSKHHHRHHRSSRHHGSRDDDEDRSRHRHKRSRHSKDDHAEDGDERRRSKHKERQSLPESPAVEEDEEDEWEEKEAMDAPPTEDILDKRIEDSTTADLRRDAWMEAPSSLDVDYVQRHAPKPVEPTSARATRDDYELRIHKNELNHHLRDLEEDEQTPDIANEPAQHEVSYTFGDAGSSWRMTKLKAVYRQAEETGRSVEEVALERYGDLRDFDDAREEEIELDRRKMLGRDYVGKIKPSGELFEERKLQKGIHRPPRMHAETGEPPELPQGEIMEEKPPPARTVMLDQTALNRLKAQMMKAKLKGAPNAVELEAEYNNAMSAAANRKEPEVVVLRAMENRMLAGGRKGEVKAINNKRGRERGLVEENEDMSIEDMVRQEKRTRGQAGGEGRVFAERIAKDGKFDNDLDYMDDNAEKLAKRVAKSEVNLRNTAISDFQKMNRILDTCPLCHHEDTNTPPVAPIVSLATRVYLTLPTEPEISEGGACIVPIQHRINLLECDDDEWEEIRNFMKCLTRMYHDQGRDVIFYENAAQPQRKRHAALQAVPLPFELGGTAPAYFKEAILSADEEWTQHKKLIDTAARARDGLGKLAFRRTIAKEMPYFHVWFDLDGGLGHIVEDSDRWPKGDLFAREIIGGMRDVAPDVIKRQGRWHRDDRRVDGFKRRWKKFDWTRVLADG